MTAAKVGRPPLTNRADLLGAARQLGIEGLTVGKVTEAVGVKYSTFYRHFDTLDELVATLVDDVLEATYVTAGAPWRTSLAMTVSELAGCCRAWPGLAQALQRLPERPWWTSARESLTASLVAAGLSEERSYEGALAVLVAASEVPLRFRPGHVELLLDGLAARLGEALS